MILVEVKKKSSVQGCPPCTCLTSATKNILTPVCFPVFFLFFSSRAGGNGGTGGDEGNGGDRGDGGRGGGGGGGRLLCNSIGCPNGFIPIEDAQNTECDGRECDPSQCCMANCSFHPCPNGFVPIEDAARTQCPDFPEGCNDDLCCVDGEF